MTRHWTFGKKLSAGFAMTVTLTVAIGVLSIYTLRSVVASKDRVITVDAQSLVNGERMHVCREQKAVAIRAFLLTGTERYVVEMQEARTQFLVLLEELKRNVTTEEVRRMLEGIEHADAEHQEAVDRVVALRRASPSIEAASLAFDTQVQPARKRLNDAIQSFILKEEQLLKEATQASTSRAASATTVMMVLTIAAVLLAAVMAFALTRALGLQIGQAVGQVQSSSAELQSAANQQATGAREQAIAMNEITTTISELLATSRQIAESAQQVAQIAEQTATSARSGEGTVTQAHESIAGIRRQTDLIVGHMLELGKKSQQIGSVLEIVSELAEQTNILAINATIEAVGAGETGRRFAIVADEIRKLADRVAGSTKEIRTLIDEVRGAVNTTVMATEAGSKTVDAGSRQFVDVASAFKQIASLVATTTEAAREIELSTRQQTTAVEQVNVAITNVAQTTRESEASSGQTVQTASQLATLSRDLSRLVQPQATA